MSTSRFFKDLLFASAFCLAAACSSSNQATPLPGSSDAGASSTDGGDGGVARPDSGVVSDGHKRVFVTSKTFTGAIDPNSTLADGTPDADAACAAAATSAGLSGSFKAWVSGIAVGVTHDAVDHVSDVGGWYLVGADTLVFASKAALASPPLHAIDHDETGQQVAADVLVWTATTPDGKLATPADMAGFCNSWTSESAGNTGVVGKASSIPEWTASASQAEAACNTKHSLYCFEQ